MIIDSLDALQMADFVLRHRPRPASYFAEQRRFLNTEKLTQIGLNALEHLILVQGKHVRL